MLVPDADRERGRPLIRASSIGDAPQPDGGERGDPFQEAIGERPLVRSDRAERSSQTRPASGAGCAGESCEVLHGGDQPGQTFVVLGAGFPALGSFVGSGDELVRCPRLEEAAPGGEDAEMWAEELVGRTDEEVGAEPVQVEEAVLREMDPVDRDDGADAFARATRSAAGGIVPTALDASVNATSFVRGERASSKEPRRS